MWAGPSAWPWALHRRSCMCSEASAAVCPPALGLPWAGRAPKILPRARPARRLAMRCSPPRRGEGGIAPSTGIRTPARACARSCCCWDSRGLCNMATPVQGTTSGEPALSVHPPLDFRPSSLLTLTQLLPTGRSEGSAPDHATCPDAPSSCKNDSQSSFASGGGSCGGGTTGSVGGAV